MWVHLLHGSTFELSRQGFEHRLVIGLESIGYAFLGHSVAGANQLHDRDRCHGGRGNELDHDLGFANIGFLDIKTRGLERAEELFDDPTLAIEVDDTACLVWARQNVCGQQPPMDRFPPWFDDTSRTSTIVRPIVSGRPGPGLGCGLHTVTGEKRRTSSAVRSLRPGAAGMVTLNRSTVGKRVPNANSRADFPDFSLIWRSHEALTMNSTFAGRRAKCS